MDHLREDGFGSKQLQMLRLDTGAAAKQESAQPVVESASSAYQYEYCYPTTGHFLLEPMATRALKPHTKRRYRHVKSGKYHTRDSYTR